MNVDMQLSASYIKKMSLHHWMALAHCWKSIGHRCMGLIFKHSILLRLSILPLLLLSRFQSCPTLCDPIDSSLPGSPVPGILQARTLEWVAISFSNAWKWKVKGKLLSRVWLSSTPWTTAYQAPPSMGFSRQEYWSGVPSYIIVMCIW